MGVRTWILAVVATAVGLAIASVDSRPTWDDTGITAGAIFVSAFLIAALARRRPWLWALLVGGWVPVFALASGRDPAALLALVFAFLGAYAGFGLSRLGAEPGPVARDD